MKPGTGEKNSYVSRAGLKLESATRKLEVDFKHKTVLDVGSSTGGFTDFALQCGAIRVIAVDKGTDQLHPRLRQDNRVELHEKTDIRQFEVTQKVDLILVDLSFVSLKEILPELKEFCGPNTQILAMVKPQFEAGDVMKNKGVIKNENMRRQILKDFEEWVKKDFILVAKADSDVKGLKGNRERFYLLTTSHAVN